jgi:hypothetical protein
MSPTTREVEAKKLERQRRERRLYTPDRLTARCRVCNLRMVDALVELGETTHPSCWEGSA